MTIATTTDQLIAQVAELQSQQTNTSLLSQRMDQMAEKIAAMAVVLAEVRDAVLTTPKPCPAPGLCLELRTKLEAVQTELAALKLERAVISRGWRAVGVIAGAILAVGGAIVGGWKVIEMFVHKKP